MSSRIIDFHDQEAISKLHTTKEKNEYVLIKIGKQLKSNAMQGFYSLLKIMKECGGEIATLASNMQDLLSK